MARIVSIAKSVPEQVVSNHDLSRFMDTSDEWIQQRSGIRERRWLRSITGQQQPGSNTELVAKAAGEVIKKGMIDAEQVDGIVYATISSDFDFPAGGGRLQQLLGLKRNLPVVEVRNQCAGFLYGMMVARTYIDSGAWKHALLIGAEIQSSGLNLSNTGRNTAVLFGDGCGVALISASTSDSPGVIGLRLEADGSFADKLGIRAPGFARSYPICAHDFEGEEPNAFPHMDGKFVFKMASLKMPEIIKKVLADANYQIEDLQLIVPHQANQRILDMLGAELRCPDKIFSNIAKYGNTTAASIPLALAEAEEQGRLKKNDLICLATFGSGFSWGACLLRW